MSLAEDTTQLFQSCVISILKNRRKSLAFYEKLYEMNLWLSLAGFSVAKTLVRLRSALVELARLLR